ncbi:MAG: hypothetical protein DI562_13745 [Stenotrophomonas acidaminiphila]|nr:MAG: hypothetical protein DI562_13745 [Stenotrophomonas acidaminiphila]
MFMQRATSQPPDHGRGTRATRRDLHEANLDGTSLNAPLPGGGISGRWDAASARTPQPAKH